MPRQNTRTLRAAYKFPDGKLVIGDWHAVDKLAEAVLDGTPAWQVLQEVHWKELWPKGFQKLMSDWKGKHPYGLYVQFTNVPTGDTTHKTSNPKPDHADPVGTYAYPLEYVLEHPADIWYGHGTRYARVLRDKSSATVRLDAMRWHDTESYVRKAGLGDQRTIKNAKRIYKKRATGSTAPGKIFMSIFQMNLNVEPTRDGWGVMRYPVRSGAEQTALLRKAGIDALLDKASRHSQASINDREPWQICWLTPRAFEVVTTYRLSDPRGNHTDTTAGHRVEKLQRKIAAQLAAVMGDTLTGERETTNLGGWSHWWTKQKRQINTFDEDESLNARFNADVSKPHRMNAKHDPHSLALVVKSERGEWKDWVDAKGDHSKNAVADFKSWWIHNADKDTGERYTKGKAKADADRERLRRLVSKPADTELGELRFSVYRELLDEHPDWTDKQYSEEVDRRVGSLDADEYTEIIDKIRKDTGDETEGLAFHRMVSDEVLRRLRVKGGGGARPQRQVPQVAA